jgi:YVTN family beta-propeller protein
MPPVLDPANVYSADTPGDMSPTVRGDVPMIYVPNSLSNTVTEISQTSHQVVRTFPVGAQPQHIVPSWDLKTLWVTSDLGDSLTPINPKTGLPGPPIPVRDPYNLYFTPNGRYAIVVAERYQSLDFRDPHTMALRHSLPVPCPGIDHMDFSADGTYLIASCEFGASLIKIDVATQTYVGRLALPAGSKPQDVKLSPNGKIFYVADLNENGVWEIDGASMRILGFVRTGLGAHGLYVSRNAQFLYVTNRGQGSVSVLDFATNRVVETWVIPGGSSLDMGNVSADGDVLWVSGRYNFEVYAIDTRTGRLLARIPVGAGPHGLCVWPEPGRYSLGHTGIMR